MLFRSLYDLFPSHDIAPQNQNTTKHPNQLALQQTTFQQLNNAHEQTNHITHHLIKNFLNIQIKQTFIPTKQQPTTNINKIPPNKTMKLIISNRLKPYQITKLYSNNSPPKIKKMTLYTNHNETKLDTPIYTYDIPQIRKTPYKPIKLLAK